MQFVGEVFLFLVKTHSLNLTFSYELQTCVAQAELCVFRCDNFGCRTFFIKGVKKYV